LRADGSTPARCSRSRIGIAVKVILRFTKGSTSVSSSLAAPSSVAKSSTVREWLTLPPWTPVIRSTGSPFGAASRLPVPGAGGAGAAAAVPTAGSSPPERYSTVASVASSRATPSTDTVRRRFIFCP
jgi:hypothetical protein